MGISLENLFMSNQNIQAPQTGSVPTGTLPVNNAANLLLQNMFSQGDVISGKISSFQGNVVELLLPNGQNMSALLGQGMQVNVGEQMMFSVKSMSANQIELNPLFMNTANTTTIMKALDGANLPANEHNVTMVQNMMEQGMSIQKDALLTMKRSVAQFPDAPVEDVVTLHALKMPVTETNLQQLSAYKNSENQIMGPIKEMLAELPNTFDTLVDLGQTNQAVTLFKDMIQTFGEMPNVEVVKTDVQTTGIPSEAFNLPENKAVTNDVIKQVLSQFGMNEEQIEAVIKDNPSLNTVMKLVSKQISSNPAMTEDKLAEIFKDPIFRTFMKESGNELSALTPREVAEHENIDNLYKHLMKRADKILETLAENEDLSLAKSAQNLKANVDFMNQVNQMFQYVQLPLKFTESRANGELYVYGNGKKLSLEDGNVSALLHLDMEHLGTVDIHVEMNPEKQVTTNFYFEDESMLDFIYEHIDMLNERLEKRGYGPVTNVQMRDDTTKTPVEVMFEKKEATPVLLKTQAFDARI